MKFSMANKKRQTSLFCFHHETENQAQCFVFVFFTAIGQLVNREVRPSKRDRSWETSTQHTWQNTKSIKWAVKTAGRQ